VVDEVLTEGPLLLLPPPLPLLLLLLMLVPLLLSFIPNVSHERRDARCTMSGHILLIRASLHARRAPSSVVAGVEFFQTQVGMWFLRFSRCQLHVGMWFLWFLWNQLQVGMWFLCCQRVVLFLRTRTRTSAIIPSRQVGMWFLWCQLQVGMWFLWFLWCQLQVGMWFLWCQLRGGNDDERVAG
jgi:hypothetical protein